MNFLERMREKPRHIKSQYAFVGALAVTLVVASVWSLSIPARFASLNEETESKTTSDNTQHSGETMTSSNDSGGLIDLVESARTQLGNVVETIEREPLQFREEENTTDTSEVTTQTEEQEVTEDVPVETLVTGEEVAAKELLPEETTNEPKVILIGTSTSQAPKFDN